jgi:two-component system chemotaxis sensor kinase CheA
MPGRSCRASCAICRSELGKQIELEMHGAETELDRQVLDMIKDPLTHMVRNSADHGLESHRGAPRCRQAREGHDPPFRLSRGRPHRHRIADDGRGLNTDRIKQEARRIGPGQRSRASRR